MILALLLCSLQEVTAACSQEVQPFPPASPRSQGISSEVLEELNDTVALCVEKGWVVGAELLVIKNRRTVLHEVHGWRDREEERPMEKETIFNLRSMAKPLVGTTAELMIDGGELSLTDCVARHLPAFDNDASARITVEQLLTHRSGLPDQNPGGRKEDYRDLRSVADYWGAHGPTEFEPGEGFLYSDPGFDVLGALLAEVSGSPLEQLVTDRLLDPLSMTSTFAMTDAEDPRNEHISSNYAASAMRWKRYWKRGEGPLMPFVRGSGTTWYGSPRDYARFLMLWMDRGELDGERLLPEAVVERALQPVSRFGYDNAIPGVEVRYGEAWLVYVSQDEEGAERRVAFGHSGSDGTYAWAFPEDDLMILYFTQSRGQRTRLRLERLFGGLLAGR